MSKRPVTVEDMMKFAKGTCITCNGTGRYFVKDKPIVCRCAQNRFLLRHTLDVEGDGVGLVWKEGK